VASTSSAHSAGEVNSNAAAGLVFDQVDLVYNDGTHAISKVSLRIEPGEFVSVIGPSGCGKSTLLRLAAGLETATLGRTEVDRSSIAYVFQEPALLPWRTVQGNVGLLLELDGMPAAERNIAVAEVINRVGLTGFEDSHPKRLSGGMKMRTSLARSLILHPRVFLFDEPFGALDEMTRDRLNDDLRSLFLSEHFAGLFITHSIAEAVHLSTRVVVMSDRPGRIVADIPITLPDERPTSIRFTPEFTQLAGEVSRAMRDAA
jgi:NitT/TauT family transport system ATP-binding protein